VQVVVRSSARTRTQSNPNYELQTTEYDLALNFEHRPLPDLPPTLVRLVAHFQKVVEGLYNARRKLATAAVLGVAALVAYRAVFGANGMVIYQNKRIELKSVNVDLERLHKENQQLSDQIKALKSDPEAIEKEAREQLRYARPGEVIYLLPGQKRSDTPPPNATAQK
jgi:cell division protein FtsB